MIRRYALCVLLSICWVVHADQTADNDTFEVADYFRLQRISQLAMSPDGHLVAYVVQVGSVLSGYANAQVTERRLYLRSTSATSDAVMVEQAADVQQMTWIPHSRTLAFLSGRTGTAQVYAYHVETGSISQETNSQDPVVKYSYAADGTTLAFLTRPKRDPDTDLHHLFEFGNHGILIDAKVVSFTDFVDSDGTASSWHEGSPTTLWARIGTSTPVQVQIPGEVRVYKGAFSWSSDGDMLSITYVANDMPRTLLGTLRTSVGVFDARHRKFEVLGHAAEPKERSPGVWFEGGEWIPKQHRLLIRRVTEIDPWGSYSFPDWTITDASNPPTEASKWHAVETPNGEATFVPVSASRILVEKVDKGVSSLFEISDAGIGKANLAEGLQGGASMFSFSADFKKVCFVNESLTRPPELYFRDVGSPPRQLTSLNEELRSRIHYTARELKWKGFEDEPVSGWLLEPDPAHFPKPWPLITFVHGGPNYPFPDEFAPYFAGWPYPLEVLASRGIAIFIPNYRGTMSYGKHFAYPSRTDREPPADILAGIDALVGDGTADAKKLGLAGHSHGAWLGPLILTRRRNLFQVGSFSEGIPNMVAMYEITSGYLNQQVHDVINGASLYESPQRYIEESPDLNLQGVTAASLFEAGAQMQGIMMLGYQKSANYYGIPSEYFIYPKTPHNPIRNDIQRESADRNVDWFEFWLNGHVDHNPEKAAQYERWRKLCKQQLHRGVSTPCGSSIRQEEGGHDIRAGGT